MKQYLVFLSFIFISQISWNQEVKDTCVKRIEKIASIKKRINAYDNVASRSWQIGEFDNAIKYANLGLDLCELTDIPKSKITLLNNRGIAYDFLGKYPLALKSFFAALKIQDKFYNPVQKASILGNIGLVYFKQQLFTKALEYHNKALEINKRINNERGMGISVNNIANIYHKQKEYYKAIESYKKCIEIDSILKDTISLGDDYNNIALSYMGLNQFDLALDYHNKSLAIRLNRSAPYFVSQSLANIGTVYYNMKEFDKAKPYFIRSLEISDSIKGNDLQLASLDLLYRLEAERGDTIEAFKYYQQFIKFEQGSAKAEDYIKQTELEMQYQFDKETDRAKLIQEKKDEQAKVILYSVIGGLILIAFFSLLLFHRWKQTQSQKIIIEEKNKLVEQKNEEILDSITYAKRIQTAILPSAQLLNDLIPNQFVLYLPKDIVAGDFYWLENSKENVFFAVADCTGHGVPGAMMSVVCHNALNRAVREFGITEPGEILDKARDIIVSELSKNDHAVSDGMDISLCVMEKGSSTIKWSGAYNPLWIYRTYTHEIEEWKANKQPIGIYGSYVPFTTHTIPVSKNDRIYLFTDGYADQFGGENGKKLMKKAFQELLLKTSGLSPEKQKIELEQFYWGWKGGLDQVDDVCVSCVVV